MFEKDKYGYPIENCSVVIPMKDNQIIKGKYDPAIGFMTTDGRMIWKESVLNYDFIVESQRNNQDGYNKANEWQFVSEKGLPKERNSAGCMILFCAFEQIEELKHYAKEYGFPNSQVFIFYKNYSAQVLKANMRAVGNFETAVLFYRDKLPKFRNNGKMEFLCQPWIEDRITPKVHPTQKPVPLLEHLISLYTDIDDVVIDCCAGSGTTLLASANLGRRAYGFELKREFVKAFYEKILPCKQEDMFIQAEREEKQKQIMDLWGEKINKN